MVRIGVAQWCLDRNGVDAVYRAAELGFAALQVDAGEPSGSPFLSAPGIRRAYLQAAQDTGIEISAIAVNVLNSLGLKSPKGSKESKQCWDSIQLAIESAAAMNIHLVFLPSFENGEICIKDDLMNTAEALRKACEYAEGSPLEIASENTLGVADNLKLITTVCHPKMKILIDTLNPVLWGHRTVDLIKGLRHYLCNQVHAKDGLGGEMGNAALTTGQANFAESSRLLRELGFSGYLILENEYGQEAELRVARDLTVIRQLFFEG
ncbi:MAG: TIM barrel protein [Acidobacteria bacterium]|nr:TIM barrel protein [Acidobacteriota bacterium]